MARTRGRHRPGANREGKTVDVGAFPLVRHRHPSQLETLSIPAPTPDDNTVRNAL